MSKISKSHFFTVEIFIITNHSSRTEFTIMIEEKLDVPILIENNEIFNSICIHISMEYIRNTRLCPTSNNRTNSSIDPIYLSTDSVMINMCYWITKINHCIGMEKSGCFTNRISTCICKQHRIISLPSNSRYLRKSSN